MLSDEEMRHLLRAVYATTMPYVCPHGRPVLLRLSTEELDRRFGRRDQQRNRCLVQTFQQLGDPVVDATPAVPVGVLRVRQHQDVHAVARAQLPQQLERDRAAVQGIGARWGCPC